MELRHIRYFLTLSEELHFRRAAEKLFIAQPALTRQIRELEEELGVRLFNRDKRSVTLTHAGKYLQQEGYQMLKQAERIRLSISDMGKTLSGSLRLGCIGSAVNIIVPSLMKAVKDELPGIKAVLSEATTQDLTKHLLDRQIDVALCRPVESPKIRSRVVYSENVLVAVARDSKWSLGSESSVADLSDIPFILFPREAGYVFRDQIVNICMQRDFLPEVAFESIHANTLLRLVEQDLGISIIPESLATGYDLQVNYFKIRELDIPLDLAVLCRSDNDDEIVNQLMQIIISQRWATI